MSALRRLLTIGAAAALLTLGACGDDSASDGSDRLPGSAADDALDGAGDISPRCAEVFGYADPTVSLDAIENLPAGWPEAPGDAELCLTAGNGSIETASYATDSDIDAVFAHYESAVPGLTLVTGEENGTGYDTLVGDLDGVGVEIRERDAGSFVLAFATDGLS